MASNKWFIKSTSKFKFKFFTILSQLGLITFDTIFFSYYYDCYIYSKQFFFVNPSDQIVSKAYFVPFFNDTYKNEKKFRIILEIILIIFHIAYWKRIIQQWLIEWKLYISITPYHEHLKHTWGYRLDIDFSKVFI